MSPYGESYMKNITTISVKIWRQTRPSKDLQCLWRIIMKESLLFPCYSPPLKEYIEKHGIRYELVGLNPTTHKMFWVYIKTEALSKVLSEWKLLN